MFKHALVSVMAIASFLVGPEPGRASPEHNPELGYLVKTQPNLDGHRVLTKLKESGNQVRPLSLANWSRVDLKRKSPVEARRLVEQLRESRGVEFVQPNYRVSLKKTFSSPLRKAHAADPTAQAALRPAQPPPDNPAIPSKGLGGSGADPQFTKQWGMDDIGVKQGWSSSTRGKGVIVAVIDTGVDYTHEDLVDNLWRNPGESGLDSQGKDKSTNGVDDDSNGFIDDVVGWDFVSNDNKPYDLTTSPIDMLMGGGNPGHGTHCAGNVAARGENGRGISGVSPETQIMVLRFLSEKGQGTTAGAIESLNYAVKMGAKVLSNSWGSEGEDPAEDAENRALRETISAAERMGALFIAAAGNGHQGVGYDNDTDAKPAYPASYDHENIISVAALDRTDKLGAFSNWGARSVDIGAPGVAVFSTMVANEYSDVALDFMGFKATWDGTSMATPHVAGAAALYWAKNPSKSWREVKAAILATAKPIAALNGKSVTGGKLNVESLMRH